MLISFAVTAKLICVFVFAYAKSRFSHDAAHYVYGHRNSVRILGKVVWLNNFENKYRMKGFWFGQFKKIASMLVLKLTVTGWNLWVFNVTKSCISMKNFV